MNSKKFTEAMSEIDNKYVDEAISYKKKDKKTGWLKWGAMAACLCLVVVGAFMAPNLIGDQNVEQPMGQGCFDAVVLEIENDTVIVECTDSLQGNVPVGGKVQISTDTISSEVVPELAVGDNVRVLYLGKVTEGDLLILENTISIFLLDEKGEPIVEPVDGECLELPDIEPTENDKSERIIALPSEINAVEVSGYYNGSVINAGDFVVEDFDTFATWISQLSLEHRTFEEGKNPGEMYAGGDAYTFDINDGALTFTYAVGGSPVTPYIIYNEEWYEVLNPSELPFK